MVTISKIFDSERKEMLSQAEELFEALTHLRYEGKAFRTKNIKRVRAVLRKLDAAVRKHRKLQEKAVFPFLKSHVPRHEAAIHFLETEHEDIKKSESRLMSCVRRLPAGDGKLADGKVYESGICLVSLLRHHVGFEQRHIETSIRRELRAAEKTAMARRLRKF